MVSYRITLYGRDDLTFARDESGNFTAMVHEDARPDTLEVRDEDGSFSGSIAGGETDQQAYGEVSGQELEGVAIQPVAILPGMEDADQQIIAIGIGSPVEQVVYGFTYAPEPGVPVSFDFGGYHSAPVFDPGSLYARQVDSPSGADDGSAPSGGDDGTGPAPSGGDDGGPSGAQGEGGSLPSGADDGSAPSGGDDDTGPAPSGGDDASPSGAQGEGGSSPSGADDGSAPSGGDDGTGPAPSGGDDGGPSGPSAPPCFTRGTAILTARGEVPVEDLQPGDMVWTEAHGHQPLRWILRREVAATGAFAPIRICAGALGATRDILVSPAHRMLINSARAEALFGHDKVLVAAKDLVNDHDILRETAMKKVEYFHLLFDRHEVVQAHGTLSESFYPLEDTIAGFGAEQRAELLALFPELASGQLGFHLAYPGLYGHELALLGQSLRAPI